LKPKEIGVMSEFHTVLSESVCGLLFILGFEKAGFLRCGNFDVAASKAIGDGRVATLIQVEANRP
jgi:hypothetical protein